LRISSFKVRSFKTKDLQGALSLKIGSGMCHVLILIALCPPRVLMVQKRVMGVPDNTTQVERYAMMEAAHYAGAGKVHVVRETAAAAVGAELPIHKPKASMIVFVAWMERSRK